MGGGMHRPMRNRKEHRVASPAPARPEPRSTPPPTPLPSSHREAVHAQEARGFDEVERRGPVSVDAHAVAAPTPSPSPPAASPSRIEELPPLPARIEPVRPLVEGEEGRIRVTLTEPEAEAGAAPVLDVVGGPGRATRIPLKKTGPQTWEATLPPSVVRGGALGLVVTLSTDGPNPRQSPMQTIRIVPRTERAIPVIP